MNDELDRRPLKVRSAKFAQKFSSYLCKKNITPNQISILSVVFSVFAATSFYAYGNILTSYRWVFIVAAALFIQCRLLCNLFDGMVAVEGGKSTASGELFNDFPDRLADPLIIASLYYTCSFYNHSLELAWLAASLSLLTAYTRVLISSTGAPSDFRGPMAKQHRMALITVACVIMCFEDLFCQSGTIMFVALAVISVGCVFTVFRRLRKGYLYLENNNKNEH
jgi:phosphatidylglycerophosphate synthase